MGVLDRVKRSWNAFARDPTNDVVSYSSYGPSYSSRPDRPRMTQTNAKAIATSIYVRMALDVASFDFRHCRLNEDEWYIGDIDSRFNECLKLAANLDQTSRAFFQDVVMTMLDKGCVAIVPIDTDIDPDISESYDIFSLRVGEIIQWMPRHVRLRVYDDRTGQKREIVRQKSKVAIIENPLYPIINEPNSTMQRLVRKLSLLDVTDEKTASGKLDLIIQLPYVIKSEARKKQAEERRTDIEMQLTGTQYGIAYTDGTEKIVQLNRPVENNLLPQIQSLTDQVFAQLGLTMAILNGTASEQEMLNYYTRTIEPIVAVIVDEMRRTFLSRTARTQRQSIVAHRDPFKLVPLSQIAEISDSLTRNEIVSSNEVRQIIGRKPSNDPKANKLINSNISQSNQITPSILPPQDVSTQQINKEEIQNG